MPNANTTWDDVLAPSPALQDDGAPVVPVTRPQAKPTVGWADVLATPQRPVQPPATSPNTAAAQAQPKKTVGWADVLSSPPGSQPVVSPPAKQNKSILLRPEERAGTQMTAAPASDTPEAQAARLGNMVPESVTPLLSWFQRHINDPLNRMARAGSTFGKEVGQNVVTGATLLQHSPDWLAATLPSPYGPKPPVSITPEQQAQQEHPISSGVASAVGGVVGGTVADPRNWPLLASSTARPLLQRLISGGFGVQMGKGTLDAAQQLYHNWDNLSPQQRAELITEGGISGVMATAAATHATLGGEGGEVEAGAPADIAASPTATPGENIRERIARTETTPAQLEPIVTAAKQPATTANAKATGTTWDDVLSQPAKSAEPAVTPSRRWTNRRPAADARVASRRSTPRPGTVPGCAAAERRLRRRWVR